ncbi:hypothetical protein MML48_7g00003122 [Holotrichia oblita]|uniref:Uncharacterized protein n=2 Tax=Holotrichia oblita TaxID=644536 RepID=A0ACB9SVI1_HOLOL|nr:hypothetical protein MML48_7g00015011 [Holotrichia oblita]KAI4458184.1 hypothetical protein MML48_7g00003122 [Holotrichia oblita]
MPLVVLHYGPYEAHGTIKHRIQRLHGLLRHLTQKQYEVELIPSIHLNRLIVKMLENIIYQCDIRNLLFNVDHADDPVCARIIAVIEEAETRFYASTNVPQFTMQGYPPDYLKSLNTKDILKELPDSSVISLLYEHSEHLKPKINSRKCLSGAEMNTESSHGSHKKPHQTKKFSPTSSMKALAIAEQVTMSREYVRSLTYQIVKDIVYDVFITGSSDLLISEDVFIF